MESMKCIALLLAVSGLYLGCQQAPKLTDYRFPLGMTDYRASVESAPIVIVGTIAEDRPAASPSKSHWEAQVEFQLHRLQLHVENVLRGGLKPDTTVPIYYFMFHSTIDGPPPLGHWKLGDRRIFYIRRDAGVLRLACDGWNYCTIPVVTGAHPGFKPNLREPLDAALAEIFLTKGKGVSDADFADAVGRYSQTIPREGDSLARQYALPKLRLLAASTNPDIHRSACYELKDAFNLPCETPAPQTKH